MAIPPRRSQVRVAYSSTFAAQSDIFTALSNGAVDALFNLLEGSEPRLEFILKTDEIFDCTGQYLIDKIQLTKSVRLSFEVEADAGDLFGLLKWFLGSSSGSDALMLGVTSFQPPATTFIYGHDDAAGTKLKLVGMVGDEIRISGRKSERIKVSLSFRGNGSPASPGSYTFPDCSTPTPLRLSDGAFSLNSVDSLAVLDEMEFVYSNNLLADDDPFISSSVDIQRMERADRRTVAYNFTVFGQPGDATHLLAIAYTKVPISWTVGPGSDGVTIPAVSAILSNAAGPGHDGQARRSTLGLTAEPIRIVGNNDTPCKATKIP